jgi:hypothetical protein
MLAAAADGLLIGLKAALSTEASILSDAFQLVP